MLQQTGISLSMTPLDQYPPDEYELYPRPRRGDCLISIEVREHELLYALYMAEYRRDTDQGGLAKTESAVAKALNALNVFYSDESEDTKGPRGNCEHGHSH